MMFVSACKLDLTPKTTVPPEPNAQNTNLELQIEQLSEYISDRPQVAELYYQRAKLYDRKKWYAAAISDANTCISLNPKFSEAYFLLTLLYYSDKKPKDALKVAAKAEKIASGQLSFYRTLAKTQFEFKDYKNALVNVDKVERFFPEDKEILYYKGAIYRQLQDTGRAFSYLQKVLAKDPAHKPSHLEIVQSFSSFGKYKHANKLIYKAMKLTGKDADLLFELGMNLRLLNRFDTSAMCFETVLKLDSTHWRAAFQASVYYLNKKFISRAQTLFLLALRHNPKLTPAHYYMGFIHEKYFRNVVLSERYYATALAQNPKNPEFIKAQQRMKKRVDFWMFKQSPEYALFKKRQRDKENLDRERIIDRFPALHDSIK